MLYEVITAQPLITANGQQRGPTVEFVGQSQFSHTAFTGINLGLIDDKAASDRVIGVVMQQFATRVVGRNA